MNYKDTKPYMSAFLSVDLLTEFASMGAYAYLAVEKADSIDGHAVRPGQQSILFPPPVIIKNVLKVLLQFWL